MNIKYILKKKILVIKIQTELNIILNKNINKK